VDAELDLVPEVAADGEVLEREAESAPRSGDRISSTPRMPSTETSRGSTRAPKASIAMTTSLCAASWPLTSSVGSASA